CTASQATATTLIPSPRAETSTPGRTRRSTGCLTTRPTEPIQDRAPVRRSFMWPSLRGRRRVGIRAGHGNHHGFWSGAPDTWWGARRERRGGRRRGGEPAPAGWGPLPESKSTVVDQGAQPRQRDDAAPLQRLRGQPVQEVEVPAAVVELLAFDPVEFR